MSKMSQGPPPAMQNFYASAAPPNYPLPVAAPPAYFNEHPVPITCQFCTAQVVTATEFKPGLVTWAACGALCIFLMPLTWLGCCLIPFCINSLKDVEHTCPNCSHPVHKYQRL